ncbi:MAG TPA: undecaprenyl/decaprenyl-phosphate alpha-N-acetylglucosaminyl 1-phosphate transferase, partial [Acidimicrobiales bacterium]|nr:undecaprenyl/decaprenyl-phosphate alpha-N-acetylglucosaminyl 1-phosphate transferase [Acidimicrobiales bacterium]
MLGYGAVAAVAAVSTYVFAFGIRRLSVRLGAVVLPDERKVHATPTPTIGGAAMFLGLLLAMWVASGMDQFEPIFRGSSEPLGVVLGATVIFLVGLVDD